MTEPRPEHPTAVHAQRFQNLTAAAWIVLVLAILSLLTVGVLGADFEHGMLVAPPTVALIPHLLIVGAMATGFRTFGNIITLPVSVIAFLLGVSIAGLAAVASSTGNFGALLFALMQVPMFLCALFDLMNRGKLPSQVVKGPNRLIGLAVPLAALVIAFQTNAAVARANQRKVAVTKIAEPVSAKQPSSQWLTTSPLTSVLEIAQCIERYRGDSIGGLAPKSLRAIQAWARDTAVKKPSGKCGYSIYPRHRDQYGNEDGGIAADALPHPDDGDEHHVLYYIPPANLRGPPFGRARFTLGAEAVWDSTEFPNAVGQPGAKSYLFDPDGRIHVTSERRRATVSDPVVPDCARGDRPTYDHDCNPAPLSRQRWGVVSRLPQLDIAVQSKVALRDSARAEFRFQQVNALDSVRLLSVDWGDGQKPTVVNIPPSGSITWVGTTGADRYLHTFYLVLSHAYKSAGTKYVSARVLTRTGVEYPAADTTYIEEHDR